MSDSPEILDHWIAQLNTLDNLARDVVPDVAHQVQRSFEEQIERGQTGEGREWELTRDGKRPLKTAARALSVSVTGTVILVKLTGHIARHHFGRVKGKLARPILPTTGEASPTLQKAMHKVVVKRFQKVMGDGNG